MTYEDIRDNREIRAYIEKGNEKLSAIGFTDHSVKHCALVAERAGNILATLGYDSHDVELAKIAGFMHDMGNMINRSRHAEYGGILANELLKNTDMSLEDRLVVVAAISNHDESTGGAFDVCSAAVIIADKTDVRRNRVLERDRNEFDIHDRVNYAVTNAEIDIDIDKKQIVLNLDVDESICTMYEYFDIFLGRMQMCRHAAEILGTRFRLMVNGVKIL